MRHDEAFLQAIIENPEDDAPRLVYADWLEERGDPRGEFIRLQCLLDRTALDDSRRPELLRRERQMLADHGPSWAPPELFGATPEFRRGFLTRRHCCLRASAVRNTRPGISRRGQQSRLLAALERYGSDPHLAETLGCLVQEMVVRGDALEGVAAVSGLLERLRAIGHPLAALPPYLLPIELATRSPRAGGGVVYGSGSPAAAALEPAVPQALPSHGSSDSVAFTHATGTGGAGRITAAVRNWEEESNGQLEARVLQPSRPLLADDLSVGLLCALGLESLAGAGVADVQAQRVSPAVVLGNLFSAASAGGAYNRGLGGAFGRLEAWRSLSGLAGAVAADGVEAVASLAGRCTWVLFHARSGWFFEIAWDLGVLALRPDGRSLAALAATDTD
jgi:uncharacterized protein (TIGR02996 family)